MLFNATKGKFYVTMKRICSDSSDIGDNSSSITIMTINSRLSRKTIPMITSFLRMVAITISRLN